MKKLIAIISGVSMAALVGGVSLADEIEAVGEVDCEMVDQEDKAMCEEAQDSRWFRQTPVRVKDFAGDEDEDKKRQFGIHPQLDTLRSEKEDEDDTSGSQPRWNRGGLKRFNTSGGEKEPSDGKGVFGAEVTLMDAAGKAIETGEDDEVEDDAERGVWKAPAGIKVEDDGDEDDASRISREGDETESNRAEDGDEEVEKENATGTREVVEIKGSVRAAEEDDGDGNDPKPTVAGLTKMGALKRDVDIWDRPVSFVISDPELAKKFHEAGVETVGEMAALTPAKKKAIAKKVGVSAAEMNRIVQHAKAFFKGSYYENVPAIFWLEDSDLVDPSQDDEVEDDAEGDEVEDPSLLEGRMITDSDLNESQGTTKKWEKAAVEAQDSKIKVEDDGDLVDPGWHGADTAFRTRTRTQIKAAPQSEDDARVSTLGDDAIKSGVPESNIDVLFPEDLKSDKEEEKDDEGDG